MTIIKGTLLLNNFIIKRSVEKSSVLAKFRRFLSHIEIWYCYYYYRPAGCRFSV